MYTKEVTQVWPPWTHFDFVLKSIIASDQLLFRSFQINVILGFKGTVLFVNKAMRGKNLLRADLKTPEEASAQFLKSGEQFW